MQKQPRRNRQQWLAIFDAQQTSELSAKEYCQQHELNYQTFTARKSDFINNKISSKVKSKSQLVKVQTHKSGNRGANHPTIILKHGDTELHMSTPQDPSWLGMLIKALNV